MCTDANLNLKLITSHSSLFLAGFQNLSARIERWVLRLQGYDYRVICRPGKAKKADALSRLNQCEPKDTSGEEFDFVKTVAEESLTVALTAKQAELASYSDPEIASLRQYILSGDWSQCRMTAYVCVKDELCVLGKLVLRGTRIVPKALRREVLHLAPEGHQGIVKMKAHLRTKVCGQKLTQTQGGGINLVMDAMSFRFLSP